MLDRKPELFRQKSIKRNPEPSKLANQQLNRLWRTIGRMLVSWKEECLVDTSWFSRGDVMCDAHQKLPSEAHLEHSALEVGDYCSLTTSLGPSDCAFRLKKQTKKQGDSLESSLWLLELKVSRPGVDVSTRHPRSQKPFDPLCVASFFFLFRLMFVISCSCSSAPRFPLLRNKCTNVFFPYVLFFVLFWGGGGKRLNWNESSLPWAMFFTYSTFNTQVEMSVKTIWSHVDCSSMWQRKPITVPLYNSCFCLGWAV